MKRVRILLRVSSDQQLEADGDLSVQRRIIMEYVDAHSDWEIDKERPEYYEGSNSAYKNTAQQREILQQILKDAEKKEFDILAIYKDDRIGRLMWDTAPFIMQLKAFAVDVYTVKDGCISPETDDIMGQMLLAMRYATAQKSSMDTGMRVKDTAMKLVETGKFMGGKAPFGYKLEYSGQISKHGRALKHLVVVSEQAEVVRHIYDLSLTKEYGSSKIARVLNEDPYYKAMAPNGVWKGGTIYSILSNPVYAGYVAYKRRERVNGKYHRLDSDDWIIASESNKDIQIIEPDLWNLAQDKRKLRADKYTKTLENQGVNVIRRNDGQLCLIDVLYCGYCGRKLTNATKYNYWTIKETGERRASKTPGYKCQGAWNGEANCEVKVVRADMIEKIVFACLGEYIEKLQKNKNIMDEIESNQNQERKKLVDEIKKLEQELDKILKKIEVMQSHIPDAMLGEYPLTVDQIAAAINTHQEKETAQKLLIKEKEAQLEQFSVSNTEWEEIKENLPTWKQVFENADAHTQRVLVNKLIERIEVTKEEIHIKFKINLNDFLPEPRITVDSGVIQ